MITPRMTRFAVSACIVLTFLFVLLFSTRSTQPSWAQEESPSTIYLPLPNLTNDQLLQQWQANQPQQRDGWRAKWQTSQRAFGQAATAVNTLWVDASATPGGDGSQATPFQNINNAIIFASFYPTFTEVAVAPGIYPETIVHVPADMVIYATVGYTNTRIQGDITLASRSALVRFSVELYDSITATGEDILIDGNDFFDTNPNLDINQVVFDLSGESYVQFNAFRVPHSQIQGAWAIGYNYIEGQSTIIYPVGATGNDWIEGNLVAANMALQINNDADASEIIIANNWFIDSSLQVSHTQTTISRTLSILNNDFLGTSPLQTGSYQPGEMYIWNNIFAYQTQAIVVSAPALDIRNNLFYSNQSDANPPLNPVGSNGNFSADPRFVNLQQGNHHLASNSPAIDRGTALSLTYDIDFDYRPCDGNQDGVYTIDIGADEYAVNVPCQMPPTATPSATPTETATATITATATTAPPTATAGPIYLPLISKFDPPTATPTETVTPTPTASATVTSTSTPTATPTAIITLTPTATATPIPTKFAFSGGPLYRALADNVAWYLRADGRVSFGSNGAEPFPLDAELGIESIVAKGNDLYALAEDGLYKRPANRYRWQQVSGVKGHFLSANLAELWYTPTDHPDQVWVTRDEINWESRSEGLTGTIKSSVFLNYSYGSGYFVVAERNDKDVLWNYKDVEGVIRWREVAEIPGAAIDRSKGLVAHVLDASTGLSAAIMLGGGDGKLYEYRYFDAIIGGPGWVALWDFGAGNYPVPLVNQLGARYNNEVAVINQATGAIKLYEGAIIPPEKPFVSNREWHEKPFPYQGLTFGVATLANGESLRRLYDPINSNFGFAKMYLGQNGKLYTYELDLSNPDPVSGQFDYSLKEITAQPERIDFSMTYSMGIDFLGTLYSGAELTWDGLVCSGSETGFYRSADKGASWTQLANDKARRPLVGIGNNASNALLAMTCNGPELSGNGGVTWTMSAALNWPLSVGAPFFATQYYFDPQSGAKPSTFYAAGVNSAGSSFLYSATFDSTTNAIGQWNPIAPSGLTTPTALAYLSNSFAGENSLYLADNNTVWMSNDGGATWKSRSEGLNGAKVVGFTAFGNMTSQGVIAATDQGVFFAPLIDQPGKWLAADDPYTTQPIGFDGPLMLRGQAAEGEAVFNLLNESFVWSEELANATPTPTATNTPTATPTSTPTNTDTATNTPTMTPINPPTQTPLLVP